MTFSPLVKSLKSIFLFFEVIALYFYVLFKFCFVREGTQGSPLVNPLNNVFLKFMMQNTSYFTTCACNCNQLTAHVSAQATATSSQRMYLRKQLQPARRTCICASNCNQLTAHTYVQMYIYEMHMYMHVYFYTLARLCTCIYIHIRAFHTYAHTHIYTHTHRKLTQGGAALFFTYFFLLHTHTVHEHKVERRFHCGPFALCDLHPSDSGV